MIGNFIQDLFSNVAGGIEQGFVSFVLYILSSFPESQGFSSEVHTAFQTLGSYLTYVNLFLPVDTLINILTWTAALVVAILAVRLGLWTIALIRGN